MRVATDARRFTVNMERVLFALVANRAVAPMSKLSAAEWSASLREGMDETLTLMLLGISGQLAKTLSSTNPCESMIEIVRSTRRNVKRWREGI